MKHALLIIVLTLTACSNYRTPSASGNPAKMSSDTLCYRYASSRDSELGDEIRRRGIDCGAILESDPLYGGGRY